MWRNIFKCMHTGAEKLLLEIQVILIRITIEYTIASSKIQSAMLAGVWTPPVGMEIPVLLK